MQGAATGSNGVPVALASNGGDLYSDGSARGDMLHESGGGDASRDETIARLNKAVRAKNKTIQVGGWAGRREVFGIVRLEKAWLVWNDEQVCLNVCMCANLV